MEDKEREREKVEVKEREKEKERDVVDREIEREEGERSGR
jgi:hypothetical protein